MSKLAAPRHHGHGLLFWLCAAPPVLLGGLALSVALWWRRLKPLLLRKASEIAGLVAPKFLGGSPCEVGTLDFSLGNKCSFSVCGTTISNLPGWKSDHLVKLGRVLVEVDVKQALLSALKARGLPKLVEVTEVALEKLHVIFEKSLTSSNLNNLVEALDSNDADQVEAGKPSSVDEGQTGPALHIRKVNITGIEFEVSSPAGQQLGVHGPVVTVADIRFDDFTKEFGDKQIRYIIQILVSSIMKSILANAANITGSMLGVAGKVGGAAGAVVGGVAGKVGDVTGSAVGAASGAVQDAGSAVVGAGSHVVGGVGTAAGAAHGVAKNAGGAIVDTAGNVAGNATSAAKDVGSSVVGAATHVTGVAVQGASSAAGAASGAVGDAASKAQEQAQKMKDGIGSLFNR